MSNTLTIKTNRHPHDILNWFELTAKEKKEFDYLTEKYNPTPRDMGTPTYSKVEEQDIEGSFFRYRGHVYDLGEFLSASSFGSPFAGWDGYSSDSFFSGILVKYMDDCERVIVATYYS